MRPPGKSLTVPGMTLSISEFIDRYRKGLATPRIAVENPDIDVSHIERMDKFQRIDYAKSLSAKIQVLRTAEQVRAAKSEALRRKAAYDKYIEQIKADAVIAARNKEA